MPPSRGCFRPQAAGRDGQLSGNVQPHGSARGHKRLGPPQQRTLRRLQPLFTVDHTFDMDQDFREIAHSGGKITFTIRTDEQGRHSYQIGVTSSRPVPMSMIAVYAIVQGVPVASINLGGIGQAWNPPPFPGCYPVRIQSDSHGKFGHHCPHPKLGPQDRAFYPQSRG